VFTGIEVPLEAAMAVSLATLALGMMAGRKRQGGRRALARDPLSGLFARTALENAVANANRRTASRRAAQAVLHGRIDQLAALRAGWDAETRELVLGHIAEVMKAGIRRDDSYASLAGDGFTIVMPGADERAAKGVAERLRRALGQMRLPQLGGEGLFTASFGVAAGKAGDSGERLVARALAALEAARQSGTDHVVAASEINEVIFLPAPAPSAEAA
jgi:diguanylate cyclase (GGDEF)-like protein